MYVFEVPPPAAKVVGVEAGAAATAGSGGGGGAISPAQMLCSGLGQPSPHWRMRPVSVGLYPHSPGAGVLVWRCWLCALNALTLVHPVTSILLRTYCRCITLRRSSTRLARA